MGNIAADNSIGAGSSTAAPTATAARRRGRSGGDVATRPDSRDAPPVRPGSVEMLGDESRASARDPRDGVAQPRRGHPVTPHS
jgi:hypothetical protein